MRRRRFRTDFRAQHFLCFDECQAWREEEGVYEAGMPHSALHRLATLRCSLDLPHFLQVEAGKQKSLEELVDFYAELAEDHSVLCIRCEVRSTVDIKIQRGPPGPVWD